MRLHFMDSSEKPLDGRFLPAGTYKGDGSEEGLLRTGTTELALGKFKANGGNKAVNKPSSILKTNSKK